MKVRVHGMGNGVSSTILLANFPNQAKIFPSYECNISRCSVVPLLKNRSLVNKNKNIVNRNRILAYNHVSQKSQM